MFGYLHNQAVSPASRQANTDRILWDFTAAGAPAGLSFSRPSIQTYRTAAGLLATAAAGIYGVHHSPDGVARGYLAEEERTNHFSYSRDFSAAQWTLGFVTATAAADPAGGSAARLLLETTGDGEHRLYYSGAARSASNVYCGSIFAKVLNRMWLRHFWGAAYNRYFNLEGSVLGGGDESGLIETWGGWQRVTMITANPSDGSPAYAFQISPADGTSSYVGDTNAGMVLFGAQLEVGAFPTSYIPTDAGPATRSASVMSGTFAPVTPTAIRVAGMTAQGMSAGVDQFFCTLTGVGANKIDIFRRAGDRHLIINWGGTPYDAGVVADNTAFDLPVAPSGMPAVNAIHVGTDENDSHHWNGCVTEIELA